jgi:LuxR family transcriptional regulator, maltose regulon positive regulatory protein
MNDQMPASEAGSRKASQPLLKTKLFIPRAPQGMVARPRLIERLYAGRQRSLTLVSAPPGFGKTTLLADWGSQQAGAAQQAQAARQAERVAWLSLDQGDNDPARFLSYLTAALNESVPGADEAALALPSTPQPYPPQMVAASLLSRLENLPQHLVLVLDDYHILSEPSLHALLAYMLEHLPPQLRLVIATRADPPIPLARMRARGQLLELRADDLRFSPEETALFLQQVVGLNLKAEEVAALETRTEGWIAGLQMAALSMQGRKDISSFVQAFSGSHRFILDYLIEEVIQQQSEPVQRFLLRTSIAERISSSLCDVLIASQGEGESRSQDILEYLDRSNLFLTPLDDERRWYRYHHLFGDLLRARLQQAEPGIISKLYLRAAAWFEQNGFILEAVRHALAAPDYQRAADLIEEHGHRRWSLSDTEFLSLVSALPVEALQARPSLGIYQAWTLFISGQSAASEKLLGALVGSLPASDQSAEARGMHSFINLLLTYMAEMSGMELAAVLPDRQALEFVPEHHLGMRNTADVLYAFLLDLRGNFSASAELLLQAVQRDTGANGTTAVPICISRLARNLILQGRVREASGLCRQYLDYVRERGEKRFFIAGNLYLALAGVLREWNELEQAEQMILAGIAANEPWKLPQVELTVHTAQARLQQAHGRLAQALSTLDELDERIQGKSVSPDLASELRCLKASLRLAVGEIGKAWKLAVLSAPGGILDFQNELDHILLARLLLAEKKTTEALDLLKRLAEQAEAGGRFGRLLQIRLLEALALTRLKSSLRGGLAPALEKLSACLVQAEPEGYLRVFLDEGEEMRELLAAYLRSPSPTQAAYAKRILQAFQAPAPTLAGAQDELIEPLTRRELEVLELIYAGASNQEIAEQLVIGLSSVKKHSGNIYGKLGVSSRAQAIARSHQLKLFSPKS